jgi:pimeloyl-ACP methyl ester carboxylesterase
MSRSETVFIPSSESGVRLRLVIARPDVPGPYPVIIFNHGSTGRGNNPRLYSRTWSPLVVQKYFTGRGWMVIFPQRRGRGKSEGAYLEGLRSDGGGYSCELPVACAGFDRAVEDLDAVMAYLPHIPDAILDRAVLAGASRGGILAIAYAGLRPDRFMGSINFVGGWLGKACASHEIINPMLFKRGAPFRQPTLWIHGSYDQYYKLSHCRKNFEEFSSAGGLGKFVAVKGGHGLLYKSGLWSSEVDRYLHELHLAPVVVS